VPGWTTPPDDGREWLLTVLFATARDEPWAPAGHELGWGQLSLRAARDLVAELPMTGGRVPVDDDGRLVHPLLARSPEPFLWRAPTDNDRIGGFADQWDAWGLDRLERRLVSVRPDGQATVVEAEFTTRDGRTIRHQRTVRAVDGGIRVDERITIPDALTDLPRIGIALETVAGFEDASWLGRGPHEAYPDRKRGARLGRWASTVKDLAVVYVRPQENGGRADVRRLDLTDGGGRRLRFSFDRPLQVSATHYRDADLAATTHDVDLVPVAETVVHLDIAHRGLGTASCGPDTLPEYLVGPGEYAWSWALQVVEGPEA
jgi:beta-galactosidase